MKIGKKFYLILLILFSATLAFSACSKDPYKNMDLSLSTYSLTREYSDDDSENYFDISATVTGVKSKDVNTAVNFEVSNTNVLAPAADAQVNGATSTMKFKVLNTGRVTIKVSTIEGGNSGIRSKNVDVHITRKVDSLELAYSTLPIIRGVATDVTAKLYDGSSFVKFTPYNTTERDVVLHALDSVTKAEITEGVTIDGNVITVTDNSLTGFILQASSATNREVTPAEASVTVLDNVTADDFSIKTTTTDDVVSDVQKIYVGNEYMYNVSLSNVDSDTNTSIAKVLDVFKDGVSIVSTDSAYTLRARNMNKSNTSVTDLNYVSARKNNTGTFTLSEGRGVGSDVITLLVYRKGYEGVFAPIEIPVNVQVNSYPSDLKFVNELTDTDGVDEITLFTSYRGMVGTSVTLSISNSNGKLVNQYAYVYVVDKTTHEKVENIEKSIRIYHYVGGNLERVYASTPVKHGEKLFINYVFDATLYSENYILVAESVVFEDAFSYNAHADKHSIVLVTSDITVSMPSTTIAKGNVRTLTNEELFGTSTPVLSAMDLKVVSSDTDIVKVIYDTVNETITLSAENSVKIGAVTITVTAPNGFTASAISRVYTHTDETNMSFMFGGTEYFVTDEINEVYVINDTQILGAVVIDGVSYDNINVLLPEGMSMKVISYDTTYIQVPEEGISIFARSFTADTDVVFEFNNTYDGTSFTFDFLIHIERVVESLEINKSIVPLIYAKASISMDGYEDVTTHTIVVTPTPAPSDYNGIYTFNTYYGGTFYNENMVHVSGDIYEYEWRSNDFKVYIRPGRVTDGGAYDGTFEVWTWIKPSSNNNYTFSVYISYKRTYVNMTESFDVRVTNSVVITSRNAVKTDSISTNLSNRKVEYNTNDLVGSDGNYEDGNIQNFKFNVLPTDRQILNDTILLGLGDANTTNLRELYTTDGVTLYTNDYFNFAVDNKNKNVVVTLIHVPTTELAVQNFILYPLDGGAVPYEFSIKINDGLTYETAFIVTTPQQLLKISNSLSSYYRLGADIYLTAYHTDGSWIAFGSHDNPFTGYLSGEYEGKYYGIHNMRIVNTRSTGGASQLPDTAVGLFAVNKGVIENLKLYDFLIRVNYDLTGDNVFVGGIAGINYGYIGNVEVISNTLHKTNGEYISSVSAYMAPQNGVVVRDYTTTEHTSFVGGVVGLNLGYVTNAITKVQLFANDTFAAPVLAGGVAGANTSMTSLEREDLTHNISHDGNVIDERLVFVTTGSGNIEFDSSSVRFGEYNVETTFNEFSCNAEFILTNSDSAVGGVVGLNNLDVDSFGAFIQGAYVQSYLVARDNVGGIAGINYGSIIENIAHINIRANDNVGGAVGKSVYARSIHKIVTGIHTYVSNGTQELKGKIVDTKVQFINKEDKYSYFNTGIYAHSNVGGLVGYGEYQLFNNVEPLKSSSAYSYVTRDISNEPYSTTHYQANGGVYYGDIVATGTYIGGLVGFANGIVAESVLANVKINTASNAYVGGAVGKIVGDSRIKYAQVAGNVVGSAHVGGFVGDATEITDYYGNAAHTDGKILRNPSNDVYSHVVAGNFVGLQYHVSASYTLLKSNGAYVSNFAAAGETQSGTQDINVGYVTHNGGIYTLNYINNSGKQSRGISDPGQSSDFAVTASVQAERTNLIVANSFYIGFETITNTGNAISFDENHAKQLTYDSGASSYYNHGTGTSYDNLRSYNVTLLQDVTESDLYISSSDTVVISNGTVLLELSDIHNITSKLCTTQPNYSAYDATDPSIGEDGYKEEAFNVDPFPYNYYYNTSVFDSHPVAFASSPVKNGKLNLVYEVAPSSIELKATSEYALNGDTSVVAFGIKIDTTTFKPVSVNLANVVIATIKPNFADSEKFIISVDDENVVRYENGVLTPVAPGVTKLRYTSVLDKNISGSIDLVLYYAPTTFEMLDINGNDINGDMNVVKGYVTNVISNVYATYTNTNTGETKTYTNEINGVRIYGPDINLDKILINNAQLNSHVEYNFDSSFIAVKGLEKGEVLVEFTPYVKIGEYIKYFDDQIKYITFNVVLGNFELTTPTNVTINPTSTAQFTISVRTDNVDEGDDDNSLDIANVRTSTPSYMQDVNATPTHNQVVYTIFKGMSAADIHSDSNQSTLFDNLIDIVRIDSVNERTDDDQYIRSFIFEANINPSCYDKISSTITYRVRVQMLSSNGEIITSWFNITVVPQELSSVILTNYARLYYDDGRNVPDYTEGQSESEISMYKYSSDTLVPGFSALMQIDLNPWYGMFDYIDVTCESSGIMFDQMSEKQNGGEFSTMVSFPNYALIPNGIRLTQKASSMIGNDGFDFDGRMFVRINASSSLMNGYQTIMVKCYLNDGTLVFTQSKTLLVVEAPRIVLTTLEGDKSGVIATGTSVQFNAKFYGTPDYWKVTTIEGLSIVDGINTFKHTPNGGITRESLNDACEHDNEIIITVSAEKTISGIKFTTQDTIRYRVVKFVVDNIRVERVENGYFNGKFNQIYPLHTELDVTYYKDELQSTFGKEVLDEVKALTEAIDGFGVLEYTYTDNLTYKLNDGKSKTWYSASGNSWVELEPGEKTNYTIRNVWSEGREKVETLSIQNTNVYARDVLASIVRITYTDQGKAIITTQVDSPKDPEYNRDGNDIITFANGKVGNRDAAQIYFDRYSYLFTRSFTFNFTRLLNEETPDPIYNVEQFKAMQPGGYYILQSDLVLDKWVPMEANFALLDGNMHVITINSFDISDASTSGSYIGLFSTVSRAYDPNYVNNSTVIQNLTVEISHDIVLDMTTYTNVSFGIIAGQNEGVITNCRVVNNAEDIINERLSNLYNEESIDEARNMYVSYVYSTQNLNVIGDSLPLVTVDNDKRHASAVLNEVIGFDNFVYDYIQAKVEGNLVLSATNNNFIKVFDSNFKNVLPGFAISYSEVAGKYIVSWNGGNNEYNSIAEFVETYHQELLSAYNTIVRSDDYLTLIRDYFIEVYITRSQEDAKHPISESDVLLNRFKEIIGSDEIGNYGIYVAKYNQLVALPTDVGYAIISPQMYIKGHVNNATGNKIGGFVGSNTGYITNSSVENISIKGTDYVAGFAANNNGDISSSYFAGGNVVSDDSNSKQNSATAGFVVTNSKNIQYSYALGRYADDITGFDESTKNTFVGYKAYKAYMNGNNSEEMQNIATLRALNSAVYTNTFGSGFVYKNSGYINNSYSNILVAATAGAGFVVSNNDENSYIENCYSMSTGSGEAFSAFTNKVSATTASDKVKDCYYLVIDAQDTNREEYHDATANPHFSNLKQVEGVALNALSFRDYNTFQSFAFNTDYSKNENITSNVWFIATQDTLGGEDNTYFDYFKRSNHKLTISATVEQKQTLESLSGSDKSSAYMRILQNSYGYGRPELTGANLRSTRLRIYFETSSKGTETADKGFAYHDAFSRLGKDGIVDMTYGATIINPYPIDTALKFNSWSVANKKDAAGDDTTSDAYLRFIKDVVFDNNTQTATTFNTEFEGDLEGNGLTIKNLRILADNESNNAFSFGLFSKIKGANVRNVNIEVEELWGVNVPVVGVLAGIITNKITEKSDSQRNRIVVGSTVSNIKISTNSDVTVQGLNVVGGVAGIVEGDSYLINTTNTVPVKANFRGNINIFSRNNSVNTHYSSYRLVDLSSLDNVEFDNVKTTHYTLTDNHVTTGDHQCTSACSSHDEQYIVYITKVGEAASVQHIVEEGDANFTDISQRIAEGTLPNLVSYYKSYKYKGLYDGISYVGGIAGIINVDEEIQTEDTKLRNFVRIRRNYVGGGLALSGQVVGGLFGYVGSSSHISDSYLLVDSNTHINATRVAGGLVGENLGTINRSYFVHTLVNQELIDDYIYRNRTQLDNAISDIYISGNTGGKYFAVQYEVFGGNPHYMGGLVGINATGTITRSYNKVPVNNLDAEYAGGLVGVSMGGEIGESYTTATVSAFRAFGGIIGIQTGLTNKTSYLDDNGNTQYTDNDGYNHFNSFAQSPLTKLFEESYYIYKDGAILTAGFAGIGTASSEDESSNNSNTDDNNVAGYTYIHDIVGSNVWVTSHLNINRSARFQRNADDAYVGLLAGISMFEFSTTKTGGSSPHHINIDPNIASEDKSQYYNAGFIIGSGSLSTLMNDRVINDSNFFKATWQYDQSESDPTKELVYEIGLTPDAITSDLNLEAQDAIIRGMKEKLDVETSIKGNKIATKNSKSRMLYGYRALSRIYLFSRMSMFGSLRSLNEITSRITLANDAKSFYLQFNGGIVDDDGEIVDDVNVWRYDAEDSGKTKMRQQMYYDWSLAEWNGISADNETGRKDETYVFPELSNQIEPTVVNVYTESDLKLMNQYRYADFVLQNDVELTSIWVPVGGMTAPFYGSIYSSRKADGTYNHFYITNLEISTSEQNIALVAYACEGSYHDFGIKVRSVTNNDFSSINKLHKVAVLAAEAITVSVENFDITNEVDTIPESQRPYKAKIQSGHTSMLGLIIAHGDNCSIINSKVENFEIHVSCDAQDKYSLFAGSAFGLLINASWVDGIDVQNGTIDNNVNVGTGKTASGITNPTYAASIGSVGGYIEITPLHEGQDVLDDTSSATVDNVSMNLGAININSNMPNELVVSTAEEIIKRNVPSGFIAFGGVYGATANRAVESTYTTFDTIVTNNVKLNFNALNNNSVSYDTRVGGVTGWAKNGYFENVLSNTEIKTENTSTINNANIGGVFGFADHTDTADNLLYNSKIALNGTSDYTLSNSSVGGIAGNIAECGDFTHLYVGNTSNFFETSYKTNDLNVAPVAGKVTNTTLQYVAVDGTVDIILNSQSTHDTVGGVVGMYYVTNSARSNIIDQVVTNANLYLYAETNSDNTVDCVGGIAARVENSAPTTISNSYTTSAIYVRDNGARNAYMGGVVGYKAQDATLTLENVYSIANFVTDAHNYNVTDRKDLIVMTNVDASKIIMNNVYAAFDINPNITNKWNYPYHDTYHTSKTIAEMMDPSFIDNFDSELWTASALGSLKSFPLLKWVHSWVDEWINENAQKGYYYNGNFYADSEHTALIQPEQNVTYYNMDDGKAYTWKDTDTGYVELTNGIINMVKTIVNTQSSGTKQNPAHNTTIDGTKSVYVGSGVATFTGNITDSYIILGESVTMSGSGDKAIDKTSIVMKLELPESAQSSLVRDNLGKLLNIKAASSTPLMRTNTGLIFNSYLENTGSEYVINRLTAGIEGYTMSPYEGVVAISTLKTQGTQVIPNPGGIIDRVRAEMHPNSSVIYFISAANNSYIQASDGCVYIKDASTIASYTTADIKNLRFGNPIALDYTQFTLDPSQSDPENIRLVLTWELKEHWYDRNYKTVTVNETSYLCEDNNSIKAEYRWNAVTPGSVSISNGSIHSVSNAEELAQFAIAYNASEHPRVTLDITKDINLKGKLWTPIEDFQGTINGNGHTISNLTVYIANGNAGFINGLSGTINELKFEWANVMSGSMSYGNSSQHLNSFASTAIVASTGTGFSLNKVAVVNCAACSTISTSTAMCSWTSGNCTITDSYAIMPYKGVKSTLFVRKDSGTLAITNCYGVFTADRSKSSVTLTNESDNNFVQGTLTDGSTYTNGDTFSCVYHSENIGTITFDGTNATTAKALSELQTEEWAGFAWGVTWVRNNADNDPYSHLPQLVCNMETWQEYASDNRSTLETIINNQTSGDTITVNNAAELAYVAWQFGLGSDQSGYNANVHQSTLKIIVAGNCDLGGKIWEPITFNGNYITDITFKTDNSASINNMLTFSDKNAAFIASSGDTNRTMSVQNLTFNKARVYVTPNSEDGSSGIGNAAVVLALGKIDTRTNSISVINTTVANSVVSVEFDKSSFGSDKENGAGLLIGYEKASYSLATTFVVQGNTVSDSKVSTNHVRFVGGLVGKAAGTIQNNTIDGVTVNASIDSDKRAPNGVTYAGGIAGHYQGNYYNQASLVGITVNAINITYVGGAVGYLSGYSNAKLDVINIDFAATVNATDASNVGGIFGQAHYIHMHLVNYMGNITVSGTTDGYVGGLVGQLYNSTVTECKYAERSNTAIATSLSHKLTNTNSKYYVGGIFGYEGGNSISNIFSACTINSSGTSTTDALIARIGSLYQSSFGLCVSASKGAQQTNGKSGWSQLIYQSYYNGNSVSVINPDTTSPTRSALLAQCTSFNLITRDGYSNVWVASWLAYNFDTKLSSLISNGITSAADFTDTLFTLTRFRYVRDGSAIPSTTTFTLNNDITIDVTRTISTDNFPMKFKFNGNNKTINVNSWSSTAAYNSIFGYGKSGATVKNLTVTGAAPKTISSNCAGAIFGRLSSGELENVIVRMNYSSSSSNKIQIGGAVGYATNSTFTNVSYTPSSSYMQYGSCHYVGGIVGSAESSCKITNCKCYGNVTGGSNVGGIAGYSGSTSISGCRVGTNYITITGTSYVGGVVGYVNGGSITGNTIYFKTSCSSYSGGVAGEHNNISMNSITGNAVKAEISISVFNTATDRKNITLSDVGLSVSFSMNTSKTSKYDYNTSGSYANVYDRDEDLSDATKISNFLNGKNVHYIVGDNGGETGSNTIDSSSKIYVSDSYYTFGINIYEYDAEQWWDGWLNNWELEAGMSMVKRYYSEQILNSSYSNVSTPTESTSYRSAWGGRYYLWGDDNWLIGLCVDDMNGCTSTTFF